MKTFLSFIIYSFYVLLLLGMATVFIAPSWFGIDSFEIKIVKSGSMEPSIMTGAVVVIQEHPNYGLGDVITFSSEDAGIPTTHRIIGTENVNGVDYFVTKGDANEERDANLVAMSDILGKVKFDVPFIGFVFDFARQPIGFALLIGLPALLIIIDELDKIWREVRRVRQMKITKEMIMPLVIAPYHPNQFVETVVKSKKPILTRAQMMDIKPFVKELETNSNLSLKNKIPIIQNPQNIKSSFLMTTASVVMFVVVMGQVGIGDSLSYFSDTEASAVNNMEAQALDFTISPENSNFSISNGVFGNENSLDVVVGGEGKDLLYKINVNFVSGTTTLCDDILVNSNTPLAFSGSLPSLYGNNVSLTEPWHLDFSLVSGSDYISGDVCVLELSFAGYDGVSEDLGYVDTEKVIMNFTALNEIINNENSTPETEISPTSFMMDVILEEIATSSEQETQVDEVEVVDEEELINDESDADDIIEESQIEESEENLELQMEENEVLEEDNNEVIENEIDNIENSILE